jgi:hypothetical protein
MLRKVSLCSKNILYINILLSLYNNATHLIKNATFLSPCPKSIFRKPYMNDGPFFLDIFNNVGPT